MNQIDSCLERLFRAARRACDAPASVPFALEMRVLAAWRRGFQESAAEVMYLPLIRGACLCACAIILISTALSLQFMAEPPPSELVVVDSVIQLSLMQ
jgi:hypothetical protein